MTCPPSPTCSPSNSARHAASARATTDSARSKSSGRRCCARYPGQPCSISSTVRPCQEPAWASRSLPSVPTVRTPTWRATTAAVTAARRRSLDQTAANEIPAAAGWPSASARPSAAAWASPSGDRSMSAEPCQRRSAFHWLWPWRTSNTPGGGGVPAPPLDRRPACDAPRSGPARPAAPSPSADIPGDASADGTLTRVAIVRLFASAREAAGTGRDELPGATVGEVLQAARDRYGAGFEAVIGTCRVWVNGDTADDTTSVGQHDEVAILPPVSGGSW
jgi:sulfur-carrier protein